jgi:uncharacterized membrane protein YhhN
VENPQKHLLQAIGVGILIYLALMPFLPYSGSFILKAFPIWCMAILAWQGITDGRGRILALGLALSSVGDVVLTWRTEAGFMIGLGFFLIAHVTYILAFSRRMRFRRSRLPFILFATVVGVVMGGVLLPHLGGMVIPVMAYLIVITAMVVFTALCDDVSPMLMLGGLAFMASDGMLAMNLFHTPFAGAGFGIMITYYLAQFLILWAFLAQKTTSGSETPHSKDI